MYNIIGTEYPNLDCLKWMLISDKLAWYVCKYPLGFSILWLGSENVWFEEEYKYDGVIRHQH